MQCLFDPSESLSHKNSFISIRIVYCLYNRVDIGRNNESTVRGFTYFSSCETIGTLFVHGVFPVFESDTELDFHKQKCMPL